MVILTTNSLNGYSDKEYAAYFYDYNDFKTEGVLILLYLDPGLKDYMLVSGDETGIARTTYTDIITRQTTRTEHIWNHFKRGNYYDGTANFEGNSSNGDSSSSISDNSNFENNYGSSANDSIDFDDNRDGSNNANDSIDIDTNTAKTDKEALQLLTLMGMPFKTR